MDIYVGQRVLVNLAAFIGSARPSAESIPCNVVSVGSGEVQVMVTDYPYREISLWVSSHWIEPDEAPADSKLEKALVH